MLLTALGDVWIARRAVGMGAWIWLKSVVAPIGIISVVGLAIGGIPSFIMSPSFGRVILTTLVTLTAFCPLVWFAVLSADECLFLRHKITIVVQKVVGSKK